MNRILVIDDDAGNRLIVKSRLSDLGYEVITTETGARVASPNRTAALAATKLLNIVFSSMPSALSRAF